MSPPKSGFSGLGAYALRKVASTTSDVFHVLKAAKLKKPRFFLRCVVESWKWCCQKSDWWIFWGVLLWNDVYQQLSGHLNSIHLVLLLWESCSWSAQWASTCLDAFSKCRTVPPCHQRVPLKSLKGKQPLTTITKTCHHDVYKSWNLEYSTFFLHTIISERRYQFEGLLQGRSKPENSGRPSIPTRHPNMLCDRLVLGATLHKTAPKITSTILRTLFTFVKKRDLPISPSSNPTFFSQPSQKSTSIFPGSPVKPKTEVAPVGKLFGRPQGTGGGGGGWGGSSSQAIMAPTGRSTESKTSQSVDGFGEKTVDDPLYTHENMKGEPEKRPAKKKHLLPSYFLTVYDIELWILCWLTFGHFFFEMEMDFSTDFYWVSLLKGFFHVWRIVFCGFFFFCLFDFCCWSSTR